MPSKFATIVFTVSVPTVKLPTSALAVTVPENVPAEALVIALLFIFNAVSAGIALPRAHTSARVSVDSDGKVLPLPDTKSILETTVGLSGLAEP